MQTHRLPALIVFLRLPEQGKVKTRIAATLGDEAALDIYQSLVVTTLDLVQKLDCPVYLFYEPSLPVDKERIDGMQYQIQAIGDLGQKMQGAFDEVLSLHPSAVIIGSDCPLITPEVIRESFSKLEEYDLVIGPAEDGGYYLLGSNFSYPWLFNDMPWGTDQVLEETCTRIRNHGCHYALTKPLFDIDTAEDWHRYTAMPHSPG